MIDSKLVCPKCQNVNVVTIYRGISAHLSSEFEQKLINKEINHYNCAHCGFEEFIDDPFYYIDKQKKILVLKGVSKSSKPSQVNITEMFSPRFYELNDFMNYRSRYVTDFNVLIEKVLILGSDLSDKIIELLKIIYFNEIYVANPSIKHFLTGIQKNDETLILSFQQTEGTIKDISISSKQYDAFKNFLRGFVQIDTESSFEIIDRDWARIVLRREEISRLLEIKSSDKIKTGAKYEQSYRKSSESSDSKKSAWVMLDNIWKKKSSRVVISITAIVLTIYMVLFGMNYVKYIEASDFQKDKDFLQAAEAYEKLGSFLDSRELMLQSEIDHAEKLYRRSEYYELLKYLRDKNNDSSRAVTLIRMSKEDLYKRGKTEYSRGNISKAMQALLQLKDFQPNYKDSNVYMLYCEAREPYTTYDKNNNHAPKIGFFEGRSHRAIFRDLVLLGDMESKTILMDSDLAYWKTFLSGLWESTDGYYFELESDETISYNLPHFAGDTYTYENGIIYFEQKDQRIKVFEFYMIDVNRINVYCYRNKKDYTLYRKSTLIF